MDKSENTSNKTKLNEDDEIKQEEVEELNPGIRCLCEIISFENDRAIKPYGKNSKAEGKPFEPTRFQAGTVQMKLKNAEKTNTSDQDKKISKETKTVKRTTTKKTQNQEEK